VKTWVPRLSATILTTVLAVCLGGPEVRADVAAVLDLDGNYLRTEMETVRRGRLTSVWLSDQSRLDGRLSRFNRVVLNESGALRGDGMPSVVNHPLSGLPWAVWSYNDGGDYELALSVFDGRFWSSPVLLGKAPNGEDDLEPKLLFTSTGRPMIVWWRLAADGSGQSVWLTTRVDGAWREPARLTSNRTNARRPAVLLRGEDLVIAYETDQGIEFRTLSLQSPMLGGNSASGGDDGPDPPSAGGTRPPECQLIGCAGD
jgi:hypothetical protein